MTTGVRRIGRGASRRAGSRLLLSLAVLLAFVPAIVFLLAAPRIAPADPDPANPTVPSFSITNPSPFLAFAEVQWYCFLSVPGPNSGIQMFPAPATGGRLEPGATERRPCIPQPVADGQLLVLSFRIRYKLWSFERSVWSKRFYWQVEARQGRWVTPADPPQYSTTSTHP